MLIIAFLLGLSGSFHCLLMCGPLVSVFLSSDDWRRLVLYHFGRLITYLWLAMILGLVGHSINLGSFQQLISVFVGALLIIIAIFGLKIPILRQMNLRLTSAISGIYRSKLLPSNKYSKSLVLGILNGLMPCGLLYAAVIGAAMMPSVTGTFLFMLLFWVGTSPFLVLMSIISKRLKKIPMRFNKIGNLIMILLGLLLILRGAALDIPYISPVLDYAMPIEQLQFSTDISTCH